MKPLAIIAIVSGVLTALGCLLTATFFVMSLETALYIWFWIGMLLVGGGVILWKSYV